MDYLDFTNSYKINYSILSVSNFKKWIYSNEYYNAIYSVSPDLFYAVRSISVYIFNGEIYSYEICSVCFKNGFELDGIYVSHLSPFDFKEFIKIFDINPFSIRRY